MTRRYFFQMFAALLVMFGVKPNEYIPLEKPIVANKGDLVWVTWRAACGWEFSIQGPRNSTLNGHPPTYICTLEPVT